MKNYELNDYQLAVLKAGANEEENGVSVHTFPENETQSLLQSYDRWKWCGEKIDIDVVSAALLDLYDFWSCYFTCGAETARAIQQEQLERELEALRAKIKAFEDASDTRLEAEIKQFGN